MVQKIIKIGTRGSKLALYQAYLVQEELQKHYPQNSFILEIIKTKGDQILDVALSKIGDKGLFTKEMEEALFNKDIDMAVHSLKDLPTKFPEGAKLGAVLKRGDIRDALITLDGRKIDQLTSSDVIATSSLRRKAQLLRINPDFKIIEIRGNVNTRIRKMQEGYCDAMVMAGAGLQRLEMQEYISELFEPEVMIPACSQGAIAIEIRENDPDTQNLISKINHEESFLATQAERTFLGTLEGGCQIPVGSYTRISGDKFAITGFISSIDGTSFLTDHAEGNLSDAVYLSAKLARTLYDGGGAEILAEIRNEILINPQTDSALKDKVIISTRALESGDTLPEILRSSGAKLLALPMIEIIPSVIESSISENLKKLDQFDWVFFTSKNGVVNFFKQLIEIKGDTVLPVKLKLAVIGTKTGLELEYYGYAPTYLSTENTAADFLNGFESTYAPHDLNILLSLGNLADHTLEDHLSTKNTVQRINVYQTIKPASADPDILERLKTDQYDLIVFTSPSTFEFFSTFYDNSLIGKLRMVSIGSVTSAAIRKGGFEPLITARKSNAEGIRDALLEYYHN